MFQRFTNILPLTQRYSFPKYNFYRKLIIKEIRIFIKQYKHSKKLATEFIKKQGIHFFLKKILLNLFIIKK